MEAIFLSVWVYFLTDDEGTRYQIPPEVSLAVYEESGEYLNVFPEDLFATLIAESGGGAPYDFSSIELDDDGKAISWGLFQLSYSELVRFNDDWGYHLKVNDLLEWRMNVKVAAYAIHAMKRKHMREQHQDHHWTAHYKCSPTYRSQCYTKDREKLIREFGAWNSTGYQLVGAIIDRRIEAVMDFLRGSSPELTQAEEPALE